MSKGRRDTVRARPRGLGSWCARNAHFLGAVVLLAATAVGIRAAGWTEKLPVPWPAGVEVSEDWRLTSLPARIGPYEVEQGDGVVDKKDGEPDGEVAIEDSDLRTLGIGTSYDRDRYDARSSNWYVSRVYRDVGIADPNSPLRYWRLEVYYYTGIRDKAPHVPERCLGAAGVTVKSSGTHTFRVPGCPKGWEDWTEVSFRRTVFERPGPSAFSTRQGVTYYVFSLNGEPADRSEAVRWNLAKPWVRYCYFAKIQVSPTGRASLRDLDRADAKVGQFLRRVLPEVLKTLPTADDVRKLGESDKP